MLVLILFRCDVKMSPSLYYGCYSVIMMQHIPARTKWLSFCRWHFQMHFFFFYKNIFKGQIHSKSTLLQTMTWYHQALHEPVITKTVITYSVTRPQWVNDIHNPLLNIFWFILQVPKNVIIWITCRILAQSHQLDIQKDVVVLIYFVPLNCNVLL